MRVLFVSPIPPWPPDSGAKGALRAILEGLQDELECTLVWPVSSSHWPRMREALAQALPRVRFQPALVDAAAPDSWLRRSLSVAKRSVRSGLGLLTRITEGRAAGQSVDMPSGFYCPFEPAPPALISTVRSELARGCDLVELEFPNVLSLAPSLPPEIPRVAGVHFVHHRDLADLARGRFDTPAHWHFVDWCRNLELSLLRHCHAVVTLNPRDEEYLRGALPGLSVHSAPSPLPPDIRVAESAESRFDGRFVFLGTDAYGANCDAVGWFLDSIWPEVLARLPEARFEVIGRWESRRRAELVRRNPRVSFRGFVSDLGEALRQGIAIAPVRSGTGIRTKTAVAMALGVPVVATPHGVEGLDVLPDQHYVHAETSSEFAAGLVGLAKSQDRRAHLANQALAAIRRQFEPSALRSRRLRIFREILSERAAATPVRCAGSS